jgi:mono/diheme cytochrome c family protein
MMRRILMLVVLAVAAASGYFAWRILSHGYTARMKPGAMETWIARGLRHMGAPRAAQERKNPLEATMLAVAEGRDHFADHCATCHGNDGSGDTYINQGLYPPAPDMRLTATQNLSDGELFYIIQQGVPFTGMAGWGGEDEDNWKLVLFVRHLPALSDKEMQLMQEVNHIPPPEAAGHGAAKE